MIAAVLLGAAAAGVATVYALRLEPVAAGGRFAPDLTVHDRRWVLGAGMATAATAAAAVWILFPARPATAAVAIAAALTPALAFADRRALSLPQGVLALLAGAGLAAFAADAALLGGWERIGGGMLTAAGISVFTAAFWFTNRHRFGSGDALAIAVIAAYLGRYGSAAAFLGASSAVLVGALNGLAQLVRYRSRGLLIPAGPSIITGWWLAEAILIGPS